MKIALRLISIAFFIPFTVAMWIGIGIAFDDFPAMACAIAGATMWGVYATLVLSSIIED